MLPLRCELTIPYPFSILHDDHTIAKHQISVDVGESVDLAIQFDPNFKNDCFIRKIESKLEVAYLDHPSGDWVALRGEVFYPNLKFECEEVSFSNLPCKETGFFIT